MAEPTPTPSGNKPAEPTRQDRPGTAPQPPTDAGSAARAAGQQPASSPDGANEGAFDNPADATEQQ